MNSIVSNDKVALSYQCMLQIFSNDRSITYEELRCYADLFGYHYVRSLKVDLVNCEASQHTFDLKSFNLQNKLNQSAKYNSAHLILSECVMKLIELKILIGKIAGEKNILADLKWSLIRSTRQLCETLKLLKILPAQSELVGQLLGHVKLMLETHIECENLKKIIGRFYRDIKISPGCINAGGLIPQLKMALELLQTVNEKLPQPRISIFTQMFNQNSFELKLSSPKKSEHSTRTEVPERRFGEEEEILRLVTDETLAANSDESQVSKLNRASRNSRRTLRNSSDDSDSLVEETDLSQDVFTPSTKNKKLSVASNPQDRILDLKDEIEKLRDSLRKSQAELREIFSTKQQEFVRIQSLENELRDERDKVLRIEKEAEINYKIQKDIEANYGREVRRLEDCVKSLEDQIKELREKHPEEAANVHSDSNLIGNSFANGLSESTVYNHITSLSESKDHTFGNSSAANSDERRTQIVKNKRKPTRKLWTRGIAIHRV